MRKGEHSHVVVICGPAGCGKSTVAESLAADFQYIYIEADTHHTKDAIQQMRNNLPLTDAYRWEWLICLREEVKLALNDGAPGVVLACSALKRKYRDVMRILALERSEVVLSFVYLRVAPNVLLQRIRSREGHYMKESMVSGQLASLEEPDPTEKDAMTIDAIDTLPTVCSMVKSEMSEVMRRLA